MTKLTNITPEEYLRPSGAEGCPAILIVTHTRYHTPDGIVIIGKRYTNDVISDYVSIDENAITVPANMLKRAMHAFSYGQDKDTEDKS